MALGTSQTLFVFVVGTGMGFGILVCLLELTSTVKNVLHPLLETPVHSVLFSSARYLPNGCKASWPTSKCPHRSSPSITD